MDAILSRVETKCFCLLVVAWASADELWMPRRAEKGPAHIQIFRATPDSNCSVTDKPINDNGIATVL
jgi:hypothetical protein